MFSEASRIAQQNTNSPWICLHNTYTQVSAKWYPRRLVFITIVVQAFRIAKRTEAA
jgi:hypothetical protein